MSILGPDFEQNYQQLKQQMKAQYRMTKIKANKPLTLQETADQIGITYQRLYYAINTNKVEARQLGWAKYFLPEDLPELKRHFNKEAE